MLSTIITIVVVLAVMLGTCAYLIWVERKVSAYMQDRLGPNRVGPAGLLQPIADGLKFLLKEDIIPAHVDRLLYLSAPAIAVSTALLAFAVVPFGPTTVAPQERSNYEFVIAPHVDIGILFVFAVTSLTVYAIILSGWASNNKYSFIGGLRSSAQLVSYEIPMGMSVLGVILLTGSLNLEQVIDHQAHHGWNIWYQPLGFLLFLVSAFAECNRLPFDLPEAEQELVGGYHTEYSALKFGLFFVGEYTHMVTTSFLLATLFLGGWHFPWIAEPGPGGVHRQADRVRPQGNFLHFGLYVRALDDPALPVRSTDGVGLEGVDPVGIGQCGGRHVYQRAEESILGMVALPVGLRVAASDYGFPRHSHASHAPAADCRIGRWEFVSADRSGKEAQSSLSPLGRGLG